MKSIITELDAHLSSNIDNCFGNVMSVAILSSHKHWLGYYLKNTSKHGMKIETP